MPGRRISTDGVREQRRVGAQRTKAQGFLGDPLPLVEQSVWSAVQAVLMCRGMYFDRDHAIAAGLDVLIEEAHIKLSA